MPGDPYAIAPKAESDLDNIFDYTLKNWGEEQAVKYIKRLFKRFALIAKNPKSGKKRDDIRKGYWSYPEGSHHVFYRIKRSKIEILGILHKKMEPSRHI